MQDWYIGSTLASQAEEAGSTPVSCFFLLLFFGVINTDLPPAAGSRNIVWYWNNAV